MKVKIKVTVCYYTNIFSITVAYPNK